MKQQNKLITILKAFTGKVDVTEEQWKERLTECTGCEYLSTNTPDKNLSLVEKVRKNGFPYKPFCTLCGCNVDEKTSQATEECAAGKKGEPLRWNRLRLEPTEATKFNILNKSPQYVNLGFTNNKKGYQIDFGEVERSFEEKISFDIYVDKAKKIDIHTFKPSCGSCTSATHKRISDDAYACEMVLKIANVGKGNSFVKAININYSIDDSDKSLVKIELIGKIKKEDEL